MTQHPLMHPGAIRPSVHRLRSPALERAATRARALSPVALPMAIAVGGLALAFAGGLGRRGALDLPPCLDGVFVAGLVAIAALLLHGHTTRFALAVVAPIVAIAVPGYIQHHPLPLAPLGAEIAVIGAIAAVVEIARSPRAAVSADDGAG